MFVKTEGISMQIKNLQGLDQYSKLEQADRNNKARGERERKAAASSAQSSSGDKSTVSNEARLRAEAYASAANSPETRAEKVAAIKAQMESGEYVIDTKDIALKLLKESGELLGL